MKHLEIRQLADQIAELARKGDAENLLAAANHARSAWAAVLEGSVSGARCSEANVHRLHHVLQDLLLGLQRARGDDRVRPAIKRVGAYIQFLAAINTGGVEAALKAIDRVSIPQRKSRPSAASQRGGTRRTIVHSS